MPHPAFPWTGSCRCGQVRIAVNGPPLLTMACHCSGCQKMTGGPCSISVAVPADSFSVTGETVLGGLRAELPHHFCPSCLSWMFTRPPFAEWMVNVRTPMLDQPAHLAPFIETYTSEKLPWARLEAVHSFEKFPPGRGLARPDGRLRRTVGARGGVRGWSWLVPGSLAFPAPLRGGG